jgi:hypothetical protein
MNAIDQFHVGIVVDDVESTLVELTALFGYEWCDEIGGQVTVMLPTGRVDLDLRCVYSRTSPRVEIVRSIPGTLWVPVEGSGIHHLGYWSDDVAADSRELESMGFASEAVGTLPDGSPYWSFHGRATGPRIELVSRQVEPALEQYWATGSVS